MNNLFKQLRPEELSLLTKHFITNTFPRTCHLVYEKQIPTTGIVLLKGEIELSKRSKKMILLPGIVLGIKNLLHGEPVDYNWEIKGNSEVIVFQRSDLLNLPESLMSVLY